MKINLLSALGSVGIIVGSFLPWYTEVFSTGAKLTQYGLEDGNGYNSLLWGSVLFLLAIFLGNSKNKIKLGIEGFLSAFMILFGVGHIFVANEIIKHSPDSFWGAGLWIITSGAVLHLSVFLISLTGRKSFTIRFE